MSLATIDTELRSALRARLLACSLLTVVATVTAAGSAYARVSGSFVADGFKVGDHIEVTGLAAAGNGRARVTKVEALRLTVDRTVTAASAAGTFRVVLPAAVHWEGSVYQPVQGVPFVAEQVRHLSSRVAAVSDRAVVRDELLYMVEVRGPVAEGTFPVERIGGMLRAHFKPGTRLVLPSGDYAVLMAAERRPVVPDVSWLTVPVIVNVVAYST